MFTGIIESLAPVVAWQEQPPGARLTIEDALLAARVKIGDSVAINGCCLTVIGIDTNRLSFEAGAETLSRTNLGELTTGSFVNIESSLCVGEPLGGHYVTGHIDAVGVVDQRVDDGEWTTMWFRAPPAQMAQMASKGSVAVDGVSLTLVDVEDERFSVALIPHTLQVTTLGGREIGERVNVETDVLAKYVQRHLQWNGP